jgi:hypothetical protein
MKNLRAAFLSFAFLGQLYAQNSNEKVYPSNTDAWLHQYTRPVLIMAMNAPNENKVVILK